MAKQNKQVQKKLHKKQNRKKENQTTYGMQIELKVEHILRFV